MTTPATPQASNVENLLLQLLAAINRLCVKAIHAEDRESLIFIIVNDTVQTIQYDRAVLWDLSAKKPKILGISGQTALNKETKLAKQWEAVAATIGDPKKAQKFEASNFSDEGVAWNTYQAEVHSNVVWLPIFFHDELVLGLWLEGFGQRFQNPSIQETLNFLLQYLTPAYGATWKKLEKPSYFKKTTFGKEQLALIGIAALAFLFLVRVPLRVVAPCEVVANDPFIVTAPLEGIIEKVAVEPGQAVEVGALLYSYDKRLPLRNLNAAQKQVQILAEDVKRAKTLGLSEAKSLTDLSMLSLKLEKEKVNLGYIQWQSTQLDQKAAIEGVVMIENPDEWRGKPVRVGEKILSLNNPKNTKIKIWIPEDDNIIIDSEQPIKIVLNIDPARTYQANIEYIANEGSISSHQIPSFLAEAKWVTPPDENKLGLKGTAILYGEKVSLFYYLVRKPWAAIRHFFGV